MTMLTRIEAHDAVDAAELDGTLPELALAWIGHADWPAAALAGVLHEFADAAAVTDDDRTPRDSDPTGLEAI